MPLEDGTKVVGLDCDGCVVMETDDGMSFLTNESPEEFIEWYGFDDLNEAELTAIGIRLH